MGGKDGQGVWGGPVHTAVFRWITNTDLLGAQGTLLSVMWRPGWGASLGKNGYL